MAQVHAKRYATIQNAAEWCDLSERTIIRLLDDDRLTRFCPVPDRVLIDLNELEDLIRAGRVKPGERGRKRGT